MILPAELRCSELAAREHMGLVGCSARIRRALEGEIALTRPRPTSSAPAPAPRGRLPRTQPPDSPRPPARRHARLNATATAYVFKFDRRHPKIIMRWPSHTTGDTPDKTGDLGKAGQPRLNVKL